jgi:hypothetical protein
MKSCDSSVCIALDYRLDDRVLGFKSWWELGIFIFTTVSRMALGPTQLPIQWIPGALSLGINCQGMKLTTHLHLVSRSKMLGTIPPFPLYIFMAWCLLMCRDNFTFNFQ